MTDDTIPLPESCDVAVIGAGPSGLATATRLKQSGVQSVHVLEREAEAGGIPRHCGHPAFGLREFRQCLTGPAYAGRLVDRAIRAGVHIHLNTSVVRLQQNGELTLSTDQGIQTVKAQRIVVSTGVRETPRSARFVSGQRPLGILTTGALQSMVYLKKNAPFKRPVIVGTELVSFSSLLTCRHGGIRPVAMLEGGYQITARAFCRPLPAMMGIPLHLSTRLVDIHGKDRVTGVTVEAPDGEQRAISCDGVLFTGQFTPESSLLRMGHLEVDQASGGPVVDQYGRCSDPCYFATGNLLRPVETAGWCWQEGIQTAGHVAASLADKLPSPDQCLTISKQGAAIKFALPQKLIVAPGNDDRSRLQLRFHYNAKGRLSLRAGGKILWSRYLEARPERRVLVPVPSTIGRDNLETIEVCFEE